MSLRDLGSSAIVLTCAMALVATSALAVDTTSVLDSGIAINEFLADPNGGSTNCDADGNSTADTTDEFVELYNLSGSTIDIGGFELWDLGGDDWFTFPAGTMVASGGFAVVIVGVQGGGALPAVASGSVAFDAGSGSGVLNNTGDNVVVYDPGADEYIQALYNGDGADDPPVDYTGFSGTATRVGAIEDFGADTDGASLTRAPDGDINVTRHSKECSPPFLTCSPGMTLCLPVELQSFSLE